MKKNLISLLILSISVFNIPSFAQTSDSTALPWTAAGPATFEPTPQPGTRCGSAAYDVRFNGHPEWGPVDGTGTIQTWDIIHIILVQVATTKRPQGNLERGYIFSHA